jgi:3-methylcrotonyl-CoA carboxylase alpha subunit
VSAPTFHGRLRADGGPPRKLDVRLDGEQLKGSLDGAHVEAIVRRGDDGHVVLVLGGRRVHAVVARKGDGWLVAVDGRVHEVARADAAEHGEAHASEDPFAVSPMTGVVAKLHVKPGDAVEKGAPLFAVEAMKMEYVVRADRAVTIAEVKKAAGERVSVGEVVVEFASTSP